jgi:paraquat-inducible protein B
MALRYKSRKSGRKYYRKTRNTKHRGGANNNENLERRLAELEREEANKMNGIKNLSDEELNDEITQLMNESNRTNNDNERLLALLEEQMERETANKRNEIKNLTDEELKDEIEKIIITNDNERLLALLGEQLEREKLFKGGAKKSGKSVRRRRQTLKSSRLR